MTLLRRGTLFLMLATGLASCSCGGDDDGGGACGSGITDCDGTCKDLNIDPENCGACGNVCSQDEACNAGTCEVDCPAELTECDGACVDFNVDPTNCGECGLTCADDEQCIGAACALDCVTGQTDCGGTCIDTEVDPENCGDCGNACAGGEVCSKGACAASCGGGLTDCTGACVNTDSDPANCGGCGTVCAKTEACVTGGCETVNNGCILAIDAREEFSDDMVGCAGVETWADRAGLCSDGWSPCSALQWVDRHGDTAPTYNYWTDDNLRYTGIDCTFTGCSSCYVDESAGTECNDGVPMRVCTATGSDDLGNTCTWENCGYEETEPNHYFGGCNANPTAGTLCCQ